MNVNDLCPNKCSDNGECKETFGCTCKPTYITHDCSMTIKCKEDCNNHGVCLNTAKCSCYNGWTGNLCSEAIPCPRNCTSIDHGICQADRTCQCKEGYKGEDCSEHIDDKQKDDPFKALLNLQAEQISEASAEVMKDEFECPNACSDHGLCDVVNKKCVCDVKYYINL
jgi:hypothetical protein